MGLPWQRNARRPQVAGDIRLLHVGRNHEIVSSPALPALCRNIAEEIWVEIEEFGHLRSGLVDYPDERFRTAIPGPDGGWLDEPALGAAA